MNRKFERLFKSKGSQIFFSFALMLTLQACSDSQAPKIEAVEPSVVLANTPKTINAEYKAMDKTLTFNADVIIPTTGTISNITLSFDDTNVDNMANDLMFSQFENTRAEDEFNWVDKNDSQLFASLKIDEEMGYKVSYIDATADHNANFLEDEQGPRFHITELTATNSSKTPNIAIEEVTEFLKNYSALDFKAYQVLAGESTTKDGMGIYKLDLQPVVNGLTVVPSSQSSINMKVTAHISDEKIFDFDGSLLFKETNREPITEIVPLETVIEQIEKSFAIYVTDKHIEITKIALEYYAHLNDDGTILLRPVWSFYTLDGKDSGFPLEFLFSYYADDGKNCDISALFYYSGGR